MIPSGIKPTTFQLVTQCFNQLRYLVPHLLTYLLHGAESLLRSWPVFAASQEIPRILWNPKVLYRTRKRRCTTQYIYIHYLVSKAAYKRGAETHLNTITTTLCCNNVTSNIHTSWAPKSHKVRQHIIHIHTNLTVQYFFYNSLPLSPVFPEEVCPLTCYLPLGGPNCYAPSVHCLSERLWGPCA
jgi:hypothetical protein